MRDELKQERDMLIREIEEKTGESFDSLVLKFKKILHNDLCLSLVDDEDMNYVTSYSVSDLLNILINDCGEERLLINESVFSRFFIEKVNKEYLN